MKATNIHMFDSRYIVSPQVTLHWKPFCKMFMCVHLTHKIAIPKFFVSNNINWWLFNILGFLGTWLLCLQIWSSLKFWISNGGFLHLYTPFFYSMCPLSNFLVQVIVFCNETCVLLKLTSQNPTSTFVLLNAYWQALLKACPN